MTVYPGENILLKPRNKRVQIKYIRENGFIGQLSFPVNIYFLKNRNMSSSFRQENSSYCIQGNLKIKYVNMFKIILNNFMFYYIL